jgi:hypothetical protein
MATNLNMRLHRELPRGRPFRTHDLARLGISSALAYRYLQSGWIEKLGRGTFKFAGDELRRDDCLEFLSREIPRLHVGGKTALAWHGFRHNVTAQERVELWGPRNKVLPGWFKGQFRMRLTTRILFDLRLKADFGVQAVPNRPPGVKVSAPERALLEMLSDVGVQQEVEEARQIMETVRTPREELLLPLLRSCRQNKVLLLTVIWSRQLELPWAGLVEKTVSRRLGNRRWVKRLKDGRLLVLKP